MNKKRLISEIDKYENKVIFNNTDLLNDKSFNKLVNRLIGLKNDLNINKINLKNGIKEFEKIKSGKNE